MVISPSKHQCYKATGPARDLKLQLLVSFFMLLWLTKVFKPGSSKQMMIYETGKDRIMRLPHSVVLGNKLPLYTTYAKPVFLERQTLILISDYHPSGWATSFMSEQSTFTKMNYSSFQLTQLDLSFLLRT